MVANTAISSDEGSVSTGEVKVRIPLRGIRHRPSFPLGPGGTVLFRLLCVCMLIQYLQC